MAAGRKRPWTRGHKGARTPRDELVRLKATRRSAVVTDNVRQTAGRPSRRTLLGLTRRLVGVGDFNDRSAQVVFFANKAQILLSAMYGLKNLLVVYFTPFSE